MRSRLHEPAAAGTLTLLAVSLLLAGCAATAAPAQVSNSAPSSTPAGAPAMCTSAEAAGFIASFNSQGNDPETQFAVSEYAGPKTIPTLTAGLVPSCVFHGSGSQDAIFFGETKATYDAMVAKLKAAGFRTIGSKGTRSGWVNDSLGSGVDVGFCSNGSDYSSLTSMITTPFVYVSG